MKKVSAVLFLLIGLIASSCRSSSTAQTAGSDAGTVVSFSNGSATLHGLLFMPSGNGPFPAVVVNHGSETNPSTAAAAEIAKFYTSLGFVVLAPHRTGHGLSADAGTPILEEQEKLKDLGLSPSEMTKAIFELHEKENLDVTAAIQWLKTQTYVDASRLAVTGVSYGGIQTLLTAYHNEERGLGVRCAIPFAPGAMSWGAADYPETLKTIVEAIHTPTFLIQAANDYSVGPSQVLGPLLEAKGAPNGYKLYPAFGTTNEEGHGGFAIRGADIWGPDVTKFLGECGGLPNSSPAPTPSLASLVTGPGDFNVTLVSDGLNRHYVLHVPPAYDGSTSLPLVVILHGGGGTGKSMIGLTGMNDLADQNGFLVAYPDGTIPTNDPDGKRSWNSGVMAANNDVLPNDVAFLRSLALAIEKDLHADSTKIFVAGFSNGASMSMRLATDLPDVFAASASVEGSIQITNADGLTGALPTPVGVIPVVIINGKADPIALYDGGTNQKGEVIASAAEAVSFWNAADGCTGAPVEHASPDGNVVVDEYKTCTPGGAVSLVTIGNGQHQWPRLDDQTHFNASAAIWDFFATHPRKIQ
ncbi:MAG TPA: PHB depolymerase family esterase [bacterium]|nr:PHB depolymerase family esterase [bacterium]